MKTVTIRIANTANESQYLAELTDPSPGRIHKSILRAVMETPVPDDGYTLTVRVKED